MHGYAKPHSMSAPQPHYTSRLRRESGSDRTRGESAQFCRKFVVAF